MMKKLILASNQSENYGDGRKEWGEIEVDWRGSMNSWNITQISEKAGGCFTLTERTQCGNQQEMAPRSQVSEWDLGRCRLVSSQQCLWWVENQGPKFFPWLCPFVSEVSMKVGVCSATLSSSVIE